MLREYRRDGDQAQKSCLVPLCLGGTEMWLQIYGAGYAGRLTSKS